MKILNILNYICPECGNKLEPDINLKDKYVLFSHQLYCGSAVYCPKFDDKFSKTFLELIIEI